MCTASLVLLLSACQAGQPAAAGQGGDKVPVASASGEVATATERELDWLEMMPAAEVEALQRGDLPEVSHTGQQAMPQSGTFATVAKVLDRPIRLPGYVVPLTTTQEGRLSEFLFVPYYGACIHVPPPPPNQIVHVVLGKPIAMPDMYAPFFLAGVLKAEPQRSELAGSAYTMADAALRPYEP